MNKSHSRYKHGLSRSRPYSIWNGMHTRCTNKKSNSYHVYGAKGIEMSKDWLKFENFWKDMKSTYFEGATIDRIDNEKGYCKENCKWSTTREQNHNRSVVSLYENNGKKLSSYEWDKELGLQKGTVEARIKRYGWSVERAITTPKKKYKDIGLFWEEERSKWRVSKKVNGKTKYIGRFDTKKDAKKAYSDFLLEVLNEK